MTIEKGNLIEVANGFISTGAEPNPSVTNSKDAKLVSILQTNSSKIVDENGNKYYDHKLSRIEKGKLLDSLSGITTPGFNQKESLSTVGKDIRFTYSLSAKFL